MTLSPCGPLLTVFIKVSSIRHPTTGIRLTSFTAYFIGHCLRFVHSFPLARVPHSQLLHLSRIRLLLLSLPVQIVLSPPYRVLFFRAWGDKFQFLAAPSPHTLAQWKAPLFSCHLTWNLEVVWDSSTFNLVTSVNHPSPSILLPSPAEFISFSPFPLPLP